MTQHSLAVDAMLQAPPERVFEALIRPDLYRQWMGPEGSTTDVSEMDPVPGGRLAFTVGFSDGFSVLIQGEYITVDPPNRISHTWLVEGDDVATTVTIDLHASGSGTQLVLVHEGFSETEDRDQNDGGWRHQLDRLSALMASLPESR